MTSPSYIVVSPLQYRSRKLGQETVVAAVAGKIYFRLLPANASCPCPICYRVSRNPPIVSRPRKTHRPAHCAVVAKLPPCSRAMEGPAAGGQFEGQDRDQDRPCRHDHRRLRLRRQALRNIGETPAKWAIGRRLRSGDEEPDAAPEELQLSAGLRHLSHAGLVVHLAACRHGVEARTDGVCRGLCSDPLPPELSHRPSVSVGATATAMETEAARPVAYEAAVDGGMRRALPYKERLCRDQDRSRPCCIGNGRHGRALSELAGRASAERIVSGRRSQFDFEALPEFVEQGLPRLLHFRHRCG